MRGTDSGGYGVARDLVLPTSTIALLGRDLACPNRAEDYLRVLYGDFNQITYSYVDPGPAAARSHLDKDQPTFARACAIKHKISNIR